MSALIDQRERAATKCPYASDTREAFAYWAGRNAEIPPPQIVMDDALSAAWERGMDDRENQHDR